MMYVMSVYKQAFIVHRITVGGAQLQQGMMETSTHHWVNTLCVMYLKCTTLFIGRGVSLATFKMYNFIIIWGKIGLVFEGDWAGNFILTWQLCPPGAPSPPQNATTATEACWLRCSEKYGLEKYGRFSIVRVRTICT